MGSECAGWAEVGYKVNGRKSLQRSTAMNLPNERIIVTK